MRIFVTGATGWIGLAVVDELLGAGHSVVGLSRSDEGATSLAAKGAEVVRGDLDDLDALRSGAADSDGVIHLGNKHDWGNPADTNRTERTAVETLAGALVGSDRPFAFASGLAGFAPGSPVTEDAVNPAVGPDTARGGSERRALDFVEQGVRVVPLRFAPTVHGLHDHGFIALIVAAAQRAGTSAYVGDGDNAWAAVARSDAARLVRIAVEDAPAGTVVHAVGEEAVPTRQIADAIGVRFGLPVASVSPDAAVDHFGFLGRFFGADLRASSAITQQRFSWRPVGPTLIDDILAGAYGPF